MQKLIALRPFHYNSVSYETGQLFATYEPHASYLVSRKLAGEVSTEQEAQPVTDEVKGETKELKRKRTSKHK